MSGLVYDQSFSEYAHERGINASKIAAGIKSMLHMHEYGKTHTKATAAMIFGTLAHYVVLEGGEGLVCCDARRGTKQWQAAIDIANGDERMVCKPDDYDTIMAMRDAVIANPDARWLIESTKHEVSGYWQGKYGNAKMRADMLGKVKSGKMILADYKTTNDINPRAFFATAERLSYHVKMGWYAEGVEAITADKPEVYLIVQETKAPFDLFVCQMGDQVIKAGREEAVEIATAYAAARQSDVFQGVVTDGIIEYERPAWAIGGNNADEINMEGLEL